MARVKGILQVTGGMKGVSMYTMRGSEEVIRVCLKTAN
jgi:hypothetical protein